MNKAKYLKIIGTIELIFSIIGIISYIFLSLIPLFQSSEVTESDIFITIFIFIALVFFAPATGVLFISVGKLLENKGTINHTSVKKSIKSSQKNKILTLIAGAMAVISFTMMFTNQLKFVYASGVKETIEHVLWNYRNTKGAIPSGIAYIICGFCAIFLFVSPYVEGKWLQIVSSILLTIAGIFIFLTKHFYLSANNLPSDILGATYKLAGSSLIGGIFACAGGLVGLVGLFVDKNQF